MTSINFYDLTFAELKTLLVEMGQKPYRARQIWEWLYLKPVADFAGMTNLPASLRQQMTALGTIQPFTITSSQLSSDKSTKKVLFQCADGQLIETVLMRYDKRRTVCISTQAGCAMGCVFCATGQMGFMRHLTVGEIVAQVLHFSRELATRQDRVTNVVFMGMGEPLHNYDHTLAAVDRLSDSTGLNLGARKMTISTVGVVPAIRRYAEEKRQTPLAISLHNATDVERNDLIPVNQKWPITDLMAACRYYIEQTGRRLTFEWALIAGKNDTIEQASRLGILLQGMLCHVNLIPLNPTKGYGGRPSSREQVALFQAKLSDFGVSSTVRVRRGIDIQAGCGQLRNRVFDNRE